MKCPDFVLFVGTLMVKRTLVQHVKTIGWDLLDWPGVDQIKNIICISDLRQIEAWEQHNNLCEYAALWPATGLLKKHKNIDAGTNHFKTPERKQIYRKQASSINVLPTDMLRVLPWTSQIWRAEKVQFNRFEQQNQKKSNTIIVLCDGLLGKYECGHTHSQLVMEGCCSWSLIAQRSACTV